MPITLWGSGLIIKTPDQHGLNEGPILSHHGRFPNLCPARTLSGANTVETRNDTRRNSATAVPSNHSSRDRQDWAPGFTYHIARECPREAHTGSPDKHWGLSQPRKFPSLAEAFEAVKIAKTCKKDSGSGKGRTRIPEVLLPE